MLIIDRVQKCNCYLSVSTLRSQKISGILLVVFLSPSRFFGTVSAVLTWICINHSCLVAVYTLNKSGTPFFFVYKRLSTTFTFHAFVWPSKHQSNLFFPLISLKILSRTFFDVSLVLTTFFLLFLSVWNRIAWAAPIFFYFNVKKHHSRLAFTFLCSTNIFYCLFWRF